MTLYLIDTLLSCQSLELIASKMEGWPKPGIHIGGGIHVNMPTTYKGKGNSPGWTDAHADPIKDVLNTRGYAYPVDGLDKMNQSFLTAIEKIELAAKVAAGVPLPSDWLSVL